MKPPRGFTLVEMLAVIATGGVLLVIATGVVNRAMRLESQWRSQANVSRALSRLAHDFRADVHQCQEMHLTEDAATLILTAADGRAISYEIAADEIIRDVQAPGSARVREFYMKPADYKAEFTIQIESQWVKLAVNRDSQLKGIAPRVVLDVAAEVGRLARLTQGTGDGP